MKGKVIQSIEEYLDYTDNLKGKYLFRGQSNRDWSIIPSIFRNDSELKNESNVLDNAIENSNDNILTTLFKMQHNGKLTRLLDLTISPLSALFFAIDDSTQINKDGIIYVIDKSKEYPFQSKEIGLFSEFLVKGDVDYLEIVSDLSKDEIIKIITKDYIIKYDHNFSYTNKRAILQGGTALLFGFDLVGNDLQRKSNRSIDHLICERIIIPAEIKNTIAKGLERIGYTQDILYEAVEKVSYEEFEISRIKQEIHKKVNFYKIIEEYKIKDLMFNRDFLTHKIDGIYNNLFGKYGRNARIWLYFYYDDNDKDNHNWISKTKWDETSKYKIIWTKSYFTDRLRNINEEISTDEIKSEFKPKVEMAMHIHNMIESVVFLDTYSLEHLNEIMQENRTIVRKLFLEVSEIGKGNTKIETYARAADQYISDVDNLIDEVTNYKGLGEKEQFLRYWTDVKLKDCRKSLDKLKLYL